MDGALVSSSLCLTVIMLAITSTRASLSTTPVTLSTSLGDVTGVRKSAGAGVSMVEVFYGIPYAKPPVGPRRFRPPSPAEPWGSTSLDGTVKPRACWQEIDTLFGQFPGVDMWNPNTERDEDCLYLNVWRPESASTSYAGSGDGDDTGRSSHKTIMVWIFGGGFYSGSAVLDVYEASQLAVREDVIVVNIAYRLGPMGFLYLGNGDAPGNVGLMDQAMALQWIKDNAVNLGGSPDDITIFGESAGAASVGFHLFSPMSRHLFNNAVMQSTTPLAAWSVMDNAKARARSLDLSRQVLCINDTQLENPDDIDEVVLLDCLQSANAATISEKQWFIGGMNYFDVSFGPIVDGSFLTDHPTELMRNGDVKITNVTVGVTRDEGIYFALYGFSEITFEGQELTHAEFQTVMNAVAEHNATFKDELISSYTEDESGSRIDIVDATVGDAQFKCSVVNFAREYTNLGGQVHMYSFEENLSSNPWPDWMGVPHGYEIEAVFGIPVAPGSNNTQAEKDLSLQVMNLWATFAKTGSPTGTDNDTEWPLYTTENEEYIVIDTDGLRTEQHLRHGLCQLWANRHDPSDVTSATKRNPSSVPFATPLQGAGTIGNNFNTIHDTRKPMMLFVQFCLLFLIFIVPDV